jgi:hypothetical protein
MLRCHILKQYILNLMNREVKSSFGVKQLWDVVLALIIYIVFPEKFK